MLRNPFRAMRSKEYSQIKALGRLIECARLDQWDEDLARKSLPEPGFFYGRDVDFCVLSKKAFEGDLNSAKALQEPLLEARFMLAGLHEFSSGYSVRLMPGNHEGFDPIEPAKAWLFAELKAYEAILRERMEKPDTA